MEHPMSGSPAATGSGEHRFRKYRGTPASRFREWLETTPDNVEAPAVPNGLVVRPEFTAGRHYCVGGHAFVMEWAGETLLVTALHVLDELLKKMAIDARQGGARELAESIDGVKCFDVMQEKWMFHDIGTCTRMWFLPNAGLGDEEPYSHRDICIFEVADEGGLKKAVAAPARPAVGEPVWLAVRMRDGSRARPAVVVESTPETLIFRYSGGQPYYELTSGAPILNRTGEVVGINIGLGRYQGAEFGHANNIDSIRSHLEQRMQVAPPERDRAAALRG